MVLKNSETSGDGGIMKYLLGLLALILVATFTACGFKYSDGERFGVISKFSRKGYICKTWEGELLIGPQTLRPQVFIFSVDSDGPVDAVKVAMESGKNVSLAYEQRKFNHPCSPMSEYHIVGVK